MKDKFLSLLGEVKRPGIPELITWITDKTDLFTAPASTKYHGACPEGLLAHSLAVYNCLTLVINTFKIEADPQSVIIVGLLHDLCKANFYTVSERNVKDPIIDGEQKTGWHKVPYYAIDDKIPLGHGEKSVILLQAFIRLKINEIMAIRWHMGFSGAEGYADRQSLSGAMEKYPLILALQIADQVATFWDKK